MVKHLLSPFKSLSLAMTENALNALLAEHPWAHEKLSTLNGKIILLEADNIKQAVEVRVVNGFIELMNPSHPQPHATLSAPLATWISMAQSQGATLGATGVSVKGDIFIFATLNEVWRNEQWSPELALAPLMGHTAASVAGKIGRTLFAGVQQHLTTAKRHTRDFMSNEQQLLLTRWQFAAFQKSNQQLRDDVGRLEARTHALRAKVAQMIES